MHAVGCLMYSAVKMDFPLWANKISSTKRSLLWQLRSFPYFASGPSIHHVKITAGVFLPKERVKNKIILYEAQ